MQYLDFEEPIAALEAKIDALKHADHQGDLDIGSALASLEEKREALTKRVFGSLSDWQIIQLARHPDRPYSVDYIHRIFDDFQELHGDRSFSDDGAIVGGIATIDGQAVMIIAQQKGRHTKEKLKCNFGMPHPEGYRKAKRLLKLAEHFQMPVITLIDTMGAYPGIEAEARGQGEAIAENIYTMARLDTPIICLVIGEGCSGGALGIGVGDRFLMLEYSYFATISPEGCASILWKSAEKASTAAEIMGITAHRLKDLGLVDDVISEPLGGAHRDYDKMSETIKNTLLEHLASLKQQSSSERLSDRYERIRAFGQFDE